MLVPHHGAPVMDQTAAMYGHSRTRTTSSSIFPSQLQPGGMLPQHSRRSPSVNTFSTASSIPPPAAWRTSSNSDLRRSTSSRSGGTIAPASGYVALLRKQKATVWCDRAQYEDPRTTAQQRAAKKRATLEVVGGGRSNTYGSVGSSGGRTNTGISATGKVAAKIRHHGKPSVVGYAGENHVGVGGVPLRLSATEVEAESSDEDDASKLHHRRTGSSGRSSTGSGRRAVTYRTSMGPPSLSGRRYSPGDTPERAGSLAGDGTSAAPAADDAGSAKALSFASGSEAERADQVADLDNAPRLASNSLMHSALTREKSVKNPEELRRRGSVDERTATMTSHRLFIANPD